MAHSVDSNDIFYHNDKTFKGEITESGDKRSNFKDRTGKGNLYMY